MTNKKEAEVKELKAEIDGYGEDAKKLQEQHKEVSELKVKLEGALEYLSAKAQEVHGKIQELEAPKEEKKESK